MRFEQDLSRSEALQELSEWGQEPPLKLPRKGRKVVLRMPYPIGFNTLTMTRNPDGKTFHISCERK